MPALPSTHPPHASSSPLLPLLQECKIYMSFYLEAANREAFMALKQDLLLSFVDVVERNGAKLATQRMLVSRGGGVCVCV